MYVHLCPECEAGRHKSCWRTKPSHPPGSYGGSRCSCPCDGNPNFNTHNPNQNQPMNTGIDYSNGTANIDRETGIRYGVISQNSVMPEAVDDIFTGPNTKDLAYEQYVEDVKEKAREAIKQAMDECMLSSQANRLADHLADDGPRTYCLGPDFFDGGKAPYPIFDVEPVTQPTPTIYQVKRTKVKTHWRNGYRALRVNHKDT